MSDLWENVQYDQPPKRPACAFSCGLIVCDHPDKITLAKGKTDAAGDAVRIAMYGEIAEVYKMGSKAYALAKAHETASRLTLAQLSPPDLNQTATGARILHTQFWNSIAAMGARILR